MFKLAALPRDEYNDGKIKKTVDMIYREQNFPIVSKRKLKNYECLIKKGYKIRSFNRWHYQQGIYELLYNVSKEDNTDVDIDLFLNDCRSCNVHTEITYIVDSFFSKDVYKTQRIPWNKKFVIEEDVWQKYRR